MAWSAFRRSLGLGPKKEPVIPALCTGSRSGLPESFVRRVQDQKEELPSHTVWRC